MDDYTAQEQRKPAVGRDDVTETLIQMLRARQAKGIATYGRSLETFNGRDAEIDLAEELIDASQYAVQVLLERKRLFRALGIYLGQRDFKPLQEVLMDLGWYGAVMKECHECQL